MKNFNDYLTEMEEIQNEDSEVHNEMIDLLNPFGSTYLFGVSVIATALFFILAKVIRGEIKKENFSESNDLIKLLQEENISNLEDIGDKYKENPNFKNAVDEVLKNENFVTKIKNFIEKKFPKIYKSFFNKENKNESQ